LLKNSQRSAVLKGHGFIRAGNWCRSELGFSRRGMVSRFFINKQDFSASCSVVPLSSAK
jgi:hypothetical protein